MTGNEHAPEQGQDHVEISWSDLESPEVDARVDAMQAARQVPLIRAVGEAPAAPTGAAGVLRGSLVTMSLAGLVGGLVAWGLVELVAQPESTNPWYGEGDHRGNVIFSLLMGLGIGLVIAAWDGIQARNVAKAARSIGLAAIALVLLGLAGGYVASLIYQQMTESVVEEAYQRALDASSLEASEDIFFNYVQDHLHLPRGIAIGVVGLAIGAGMGLASLSWRRALNGAIGGVVGGFIGGFLFDYIATASDDSAWLPRAVAILLIGLLIGVLTGLIEIARRDHWLEIVSGGMAGKQFIVYHQRSVVGSASDAAITLIKDPGIAPRHAVLERSGKDLMITAVDPAYPLIVNGGAVSSHRLRDSDLLQLGSSVVRYRSKEAAAPISGHIHGSG